MLAPMAPPVSVPKEERASEGEQVWEGERVGREIRYDLELKQVEGKIENPFTGTEDRVLLRTYVSSDKKQSSDANRPRFIAPRIDIKPGATVRITLHNKLPAEQQSKCTNHENNPNCFNTTNLHVHGLWVSPTGNSDNVLLEIKPNTEFQYEYNVPVDHPAGTYWYHPHVHGSTAVQVGSGMAGALIIRGSRKPLLGPDGQVQRPGDIDVLLKSFDPKPGSNDYPDVLLFQQIPYACFRKDAKGDPQIKTNDGRWSCDKDDSGAVNNFQEQMGPGKWKKSGRYTSINGSIQRDILMKAGTVYRWRMIDAGIHEPIGVKITRLDSSVKWPTRPGYAEETEFIEKHCEQGEVVPQFEVATDGLTREKMVKREKNILQPGYRSDVLFAFPSEGTYCFYDAATRTSLDPNNNEPDAPRLLGKVIVKGGTAFSEGAETFIRERLKQVAKGTFTGAVQKRVLYDLEQLNTSAFAPHKPFSEKELNAMSEDCYNAPKGQKPECVKFYVGNQYRDDPNSPIVFQINGKSFGENPPRVLQLDKAQKWILTSEVANHPFHIHVNPFQIVQILKKDGTGDKTYKEIDYAKDEEYAGMKGAWKDTIIVKQDYKVIIASRYKRYIGDFVLHCHLLDHEDKGMMELVRIVHSDSEGNPVSSTHEHHLMADDTP
jgi:FtsP/CotA-like multicopper oxidase with cupredoxin domain